MKPYVVETSESIELLESQVVDRMSAGYELAGGISFNPVEVVFMQALYLPRVDKQADELLQAEQPIQEEEGNIYDKRGFLSI